MSKMKKWMVAVIALMVAVAVVAVILVKNQDSQTVYEKVDPDTNSTASGDSDTAGDNGDNAVTPDDGDHASTPDGDSSSSTDSDEGGVNSTTTQPATNDNQPSEDNSQDNVVEFDWGDSGDDGDNSQSTTPSSSAAPTTTTTRPPVGTRVFPKEGDKPHENLLLTKVEVKGNQVTLHVKNVTTGLESNMEDRMYFACYDKQSKLLDTVQVNSGRINPGETVTKTVTVPSGTHQMLFEKYEGEFWTHGWV